MLSTLIHASNRSFFSQHSAQLDLLKNHPEAISTLAKWLYEEWHTRDASLTVEKLVHSFHQRLNSDKVPITFVVLKELRPIGCVSLKYETAPELSDFPEKSLWLGSLQVVAEERNRAIGQELIRFSKEAAKLFGHQRLYFYTSNPDNVSWYIKQGASLIERRPFRGHEITLMQLIDFL